MGYVIEERQSLGRRSRVRFLSGMPSPHGDYEWSEKLRDGLVFEQNEASAIVGDFSKRHLFNTTIRKVGRQSTHSLIWVEKHTREIWIGPGGERLKARVGCNSETGELF